MRDLLNPQAKRALRIIFIDEIDAITVPVENMMMSNDECGNTLNQLLVEIGGFGTDPVSSSSPLPTGRMCFDSALLRPGR